MTIAEAATRLLHQVLGARVAFHPGQLEAIEAIAERRARVLVVQRTGWGKSIVYFIATRLLRDRGAGPTILISPLLALMRDQQRAAAVLGLRARSIDSTNQSDWSQIEAELERDEVDLLMISPERLANQRFRTRTQRAIELGIGLFVVDEAHCISDWGHDFRPDYQRIRDIVSSLAGVPVLATTATANDRVVRDIESQLGPRLEVFRGPLARDSLRLQAITLETQAERLAWLPRYLREVEGSGIVYVLTVPDARRVSAWLREQGIDAPAYYGGLGADQRRRLENELRQNRIKALVATVALGMGFDKPDLSFVVHFQRPPSAIGYYQQIGRAGRAVDSADAILLAGQEDDRIGEHFIDTAFPPVELMRAVVDALTDSEGMTIAGLEAVVNARHDLLERSLKILEVERAVSHEDKLWHRTVNPWEPDLPRIEAVTRTRREELRRMQEFVATDACLMEFLVADLDDPAAARCGRCANDAGPFVETAVDPELVREAVRFLKGSHRPIQARKLWPRGLADRAGAIPKEQQLQDGLALSIYGDAGWGELVREGKYGEGGFDPELVEAMAEMIEVDLDVEEKLTWVAAVPSWRRPELVPAFAQRLSERLGLPYRSALVKSGDKPQQKEMENSLMQARNALGGFSASPAEVLPGPVLLVDDMVDSRWTLTVCGVALLEAGSGAVYPVVLAETTGRGT